MLYDDIVANHALWMAFFDIRDNVYHAEHTCGILVRSLSTANTQLTPAALINWIIHVSIVTS